MSQVSGVLFQRAVEYSFKVNPGEPGQERLAHSVFVGPLVVSSDGMRRADGYLPDGMNVSKPFAATRTSMGNLIKRLSFAYAMSRRLNVEFMVELKARKVTMTWGKEEMVHELDEAAVGDLPREATAPVSLDAPVLSVAQTDLDAGHLADAVKRYTSWGKDHGSVTLRGEGGKAMVAIDVHDGEGNSIGTTYLRPAEAPPAALPSDEPLFAKLHPGAEAGQSVLSLLWNSPADGVVVPDAEDVDDQGRSKAKKPSAARAPKKKRKR